MNEIPRAYNRLDTFLKAVLLFGFFVFIYCTLLLHDARAEDRLLLLYSGNVNGEIEGCG
jgi:hypothetical protein